MNMTNYWHYYLRAADLSTIEDVLLSAGLLVEEEDEEGILQKYPASKTHLYIAGELYEGGEWDEEGNLIVPRTKLPGFHVNLCTEFEVNTVDIESILIEPPANPHYVWSD